MPAIFVHGVPDTHRLWNPLLRQLLRNDVIALSLPGFDAPIPSSFNATKEEYVEWLVQELEQIGEPVDLVGHDWGAILVQRVASLRPDLVRTWICGSGPIDKEYVWHELAQQWQTPVVGEQVMAAITSEGLKQALVVNGVPREMAEESAKFMDATMKKCILSLYRSAVNVGAEWQADVATINRPALILWGKNDPYVPSHFAHRLAERVRGELAIFERFGHWWPVECPVEAALAIERFWSLHESKRESSS